MPGNEKKVGTPSLKREKSLKRT